MVSNVVTGKGMDIFASSNASLTKIITSLIEATRLVCVPSSINQRTLKTTLLSANAVAITDGSASFDTVGAALTHLKSLVEHQ